MIQLMNAVLVAVILALFAIDAHTGVQMAALVATTILAITLIPARLLGLTALKRLEPDVLMIARNGKWLGIWTCVWFMLYAVMAVVAYFGPPANGWQFLHDLLVREMVLLTASLAIFIVLFALSNSWSYQHVKWWKHINMAIWLTVPFIFTHLLLSSSIYNQDGLFWPTWVLLGLIVAAGVSGLLRAKRDYFARHRVWLLVVGAVVSVLVVLFYPAIV